MHWPGHRPLPRGGWSDLRPSYARQTERTAGIWQGVDMSQSPATNARPIGGVGGRLCCGRGRVLGCSTAGAKGVGETRCPWRPGRSPRRPLARVAAPGDRARQRRSKTPCGHRGQRCGRQTPSDEWPVAAEQKLLRRERRCVGTAMLGFASLTPTYRVSARPDLGPDAAMFG